MDSIYIGSSPKIAVDYTGQGSLVIFLHGIGGNRRNWKNQLEALAPHYRAVAWDMRGYGDSEDYDGPLNMDDICADLLRILDHFQSDKAHIVGLSMGGMVALEFYRRCPHHVRSLLLCNTNSGLIADFTTEQKSEFIRIRKEPLLQGKSPKDLVPAMLQVLLGKNTPQSGINNITESLNLLRKESYIKAIELVINIDCTDVLGKIDVPTLLIGSTSDMVTPLESMQIMAKKIAGAKLIVFENAGHLSNLEDPEKFNKVLTDFLFSADEAANLFQE